MKDLTQESSRSANLPTPAQPSYHTGNFLLFLLNLFVTYFLKIQQKRMYHRFRKYRKQEAQRHLIALHRVCRIPCMYKECQCHMGRPQMLHIQHTFHHQCPKDTILMERCRIQAIIIILVVFHKLVLQVIHNSHHMVIRNSLKVFHNHLHKVTHHKIHGKKRRKKRVKSAIIIIALIPTKMLTYFFR